MTLQVSGSKPSKLSRLEAPSQPPPTKYPQLTINLCFLMSDIWSYASSWVDAFPPKDFSKNKLMERTQRIIVENLLREVLEGEH